MAFRKRPPKRPGIKRMEKIVLNDNLLLTRALTYILAEYGHPILIPDQVMRGLVEGSGLIIDERKGGTYFASSRPRRLRHRILLFFRSLPRYWRARQRIKAARTSTRTDEGAVQAPGTSDLGGGAS